MRFSRQPDCRADRGATPRSISRSGGSGRSHRTRRLLGPDRARRTVVGAAALVVAVAAAGCGASGGPGVYLGLSAPPGTELPVGRAAAGAAGPGLGPATTAPSTGAAGNVAAFCQDSQTLPTLVRDLVQAGGRANTVAATKALDSHFVRDAPTEIQPQVSLVVQTNERLVTDLTANPINLADFAQGWGNIGYQLAVQQIVAYGFAHC